MTKFSVEKCVRFIEEDVERDVAPSIEIIAHQFGVSYRHLHRAFLELMGVPPATYRRHISMEAAALRLRWSREDVGRIGYATGFRSRSAFTHVFFRNFGMTPTDYRRAVHRAVVLEGPGPCATYAPIDEMEPVRLLAKRYRGRPEQIESFWNDFERHYVRRLAPEFLQYQRVGLIHNDWRVGQAGAVRYDCCLVADQEALASSSGETVGLHDIVIRSDRYAGYRFNLEEYDRLSAYPLVGDNLFHQKSLNITEKPALEYLGPPGGAVAESRGAVTLLFQVE
jgi:AraC family transcriptional regulator